MESSTVDADWMEFFCKSGQILFYYNKVTAEHRWPDRSCGYENGALIGGQPLFCVGTQTDDYGCKNGCSSVCADGCLIQPVNSRNVDDGLLKAKNMKKIYDPRYVDNDSMHPNIVLNEGHAENELLQADKTPVKEKSSRCIGTESGLTQQPCCVERQDLSRGIIVDGNLTKPGKIKRQDISGCASVNCCVTQPSNVEKQDVSRSVHTGFDHGLMEVNSVKKESLDENLELKAHDHLLPISQEPQNTVILHGDREIQVIHAPIAQFAVAVDTENDSFESCLNAEEKLRMQSGGSFFISSREHSVEGDPSIDTEEYHGGIHDKPFTHKTNVRAHTETHSVPKPHICMTCGKSFRQKGTLKSHEDTHTGLKPHECEICGKSFTHRRSFLRHELVHTDVKPYVCKTCGKAYRHKQSLDVHEYSHTGVKPFECRICGKSFSNKKYLKTHEEIHAGRKQYGCQNCGKTFTLKANLKMHIDSCTDAGGKSFPCQTCGKTYTRKTNLKRHEETSCGKKSTETPQEMS